MTETEYGEIVETTIIEDKIVYTAHSNGRVMMGQLTSKVGPFTTLSEKSLESLAEQLIGTRIEWPTQRGQEHE